MQTNRRPAGFFGAMLVGIAFAFGWTPCIGPILAGILAVAAAQDTVSEGVMLLLAYSLGLGDPVLRDGARDRSVLRRVRRASESTTI